MNSFIETLNLWGGKFLGFAWPMLWQSSLLITALLAFDFLCRRKIRASIRYALWLVVLAKLCLPPTLALPTGAAWWLFPSKTTAKAPVTTKYVVTYDTTAPTDSIQPIIPVLAPPPPKLDAAGWTLLGCGFVSAALLLWLAMRWWQISRKVSGATESAELAGLLEEIRGRSGLRSPLRLKLVGGQMSPAVCGLVRPVILLPRVLVEQLSAAQLRAVLLHEAFHLRRRDVWVNCAQALLQIIYWWHPLLWLANARIRRLREQAVDDAVMLALSGEAESYAPTLLAVAKLAFSRPLMSLGLVGIMESRSALRKRIERLVNFHAPRKAGLTFLSLCGVLAFSAVALPMGQAPVVYDNSSSLDVDSSELKMLTVKVDPDVFIRNVKARAAQYMLSPTNDWTSVLLEILRSEDVDSPKGIVFTNRTGEIMMQNTPAKLAIFQQVVDQLNRADGISELPLHNNFRRKSVLIEARLYQMPAADFKSIAADLQFYPDSRSSDDWRSASPEKFKPLMDSLESSGLRPILRPRIQTGSGMPAEMHIGSNSNSVDIECKPYAGEGFIDLRIRGSIIANATASGPFTNHFSVEASAQNGGGIVIRVENFDGYADSNLVAVINMEVVTNIPTAHFQERLQAITGPWNSAATNNAQPHFAQRLVRLTQPVSGEAASQAGTLVQDAKVLREMGKLDDAEKKFQTALAINPDDQVARHYTNLIAQNRQGAVFTIRTNSVMTNRERKIVVAKLNQIRLDHVLYVGVPLGEVLRQLTDESKQRDPEKVGVNFRTEGTGLIVVAGYSFDADTGLSATRNAPVYENVNSIPVTITPALEDVQLGNVLEAIVKGANGPIHYAILADGSVVFSFGKPATLLSSGKPTSLLYMRTFKVDQTTFISGLRKMGGTDAGINETTNSAAAISKMAAAYFSKLGVDFESPPGKSVFYSDRLGLLFVKATATDLDTIEQAILALISTAPQIHIKAWFVEVPKQGFVFSLPGTNVSAGQATRILSDPQMRTVENLLEPKPGFKALAEPEVVTTSGRQTQMRATQITTVVTNFAFSETASNAAVFPQSGKVELGPVLDTVATVLPDGFTIDLKTTASVTEFLGYDKPTNHVFAVNRAGEKVTMPTVLPRFRIRQATTQVRLWDNQTVVLGNLPASLLVAGKPVSPQPKEDDKSVIVFITVTMVDPAGNRVHSDDEMPFAKAGPPPQPY